MPTPRAHIIGSGPNGLAAAIVLARAGFRTTVYEQSDTLGGGCRSTKRWGLIHDTCAAVHPTALASPFFRSLTLPVTFAQPDIPLVHPLPDGTGHSLYRDIGRMPRAWQKLFNPLVDHIDAVTSLVFSRRRTHLPTMARFGLRAARPATSRDLLFQGIAAHAFTRLDRPGTSAIGLVLGSFAHTYGWPVIVGGSGALIDALVETATHAGSGVRFHTNAHIRSASDLDTGARDVIILNTTPRFAAAFLSGTQPRRRARRYRRFRYGPAAYRIDFALRGHIPWAFDDARHAGTIHLGDPTSAEAAVAAGTLPTQPFTLIAQQYLADPSRSADGLNPIWAYAHVPSNYQGNATQLIVDHIEHHAPGFAQRIEHVHATPVAELEAYNPNNIGGDIAGGANTLNQLAARPTLRAPYDTGVPGVYLASASTAPGAGVHGMAGYHAARRAIELHGE